MPYWSHKTSEVQEGTKIGDGTKIWHNSQVMKGAEIGENCTIGHNCFVGSNVKMGKGVKIECNTDVWEKVTLEDYVFVGPSAVFTNDPNPRAKYPKSKFPEYGKWKETVVKEGASIGANATIVCGNTIGKWAFVGAGSVVTKDIPDHALVRGVPARIAGWVCECGNKLENLTKPAKRKSEKEKCKVCGREYIKRGDNVSESSQPS